MAELINKEASFTDRVIGFYQGLQPDFELPSGVEILLPYANPEVMTAVKAWYNRYYKGDHNRIFLLGINPGRLGGGLTGIPFTDPVRLKEAGIEHSFPMKSELSSNFIYTFLHEYGGLTKFAEHFFMTAICPVGFIRDGKNYNYYDDAGLEASARFWICETMRQQVKAGGVCKVAVCLGEGNNFSYLSGLNATEKWFDEVISLPHPRWIMQYKRKSMPQYIDKYMSTLESLCD